MYDLFFSSFLLALQPYLGFGLLHCFVTVLFSGCGHKPHAQLSTWTMRDYTSSGPNLLTCLSWVALPGAYTPASIARRVIGARKSPLHDKAVVL
jgi:hypothetical protein